MFHLAHISDLHLLDLSGARLRHFVNKRVTGGLNLILKRAHTHRSELVEQALRQIDELDVDHLVVTGDLSNLSLDAELTRAREMLSPFGGGRDISVIPGNHDAYTYRSARRGAFEEHFSDYMTSELPDLVRDRCYPYVKLFDGVAVIGLSSAVATPPIYATGHVSAPQLEGLRAALGHPELADRFRVVLVHHHLFPPPHKRLNRMRRLVNGDELLSVLLEGRAQLLLHGHNHRHAFTLVPYPDGSGHLAVSEAGSTSAAYADDRDRSGKFNLYRIAEGRLESVDAFVFSDNGSATGGAFVPYKTIRPDAL